MLKFPLDVSFQSVNHPIRQHLLVNGSQLQFPVKFNSTAPSKSIIAFDTSPLKATPHPQTFVHPF